MWEGLAVTTQALFQGYVALAGSSLPFSTGDNSVLMKWQHKSLPSKSSVLGDRRETRKSGGQD